MEVWSIREKIIIAASQVSKSYDVGPSRSNERMRGRYSTNTTALHNARDRNDKVNAKQPDAYESIPACSLMQSDPYFGKNTIASFVKSDPAKYTAANRSISFKRASTNDDKRTISAYLVIIYIANSCVRENRLFGCSNKTGFSGAWRTRNQHAKSSSAWKISNQKVAHAAAARRKNATGASRRVGCSLVCLRLTATLRRIGCAPVVIQ